MKCVLSYKVNLHRRITFKEEKQRGEEPATTGVCPSSSHLSVAYLSLYHVTSSPCSRDAICGLRAWASYHGFCRMLPILLQNAIYCLLLVFSVDVLCKHFMCLWFLPCGTLKLFDDLGLIQFPLVCGETAANLVE